jgi:hypothetical protein
VIPHATITDLPGLDHFAHLADPAGFASVVRSRSADYPTPHRGEERRGATSRVACLLSDSGDDDQFAARAAVLHEGVRLNDLVETIGARDRNGCVGGGDIVEEVLQHRGGKSAASPL